MRLRARSIAWLLPLLLCACAHNKNISQMQPLAPPLEDTAPPPPDLAPNALPPPVYNIPKTPEPVAVPQEQPKPAPRHHRPKPAQGTTPGTQPTQAADATPAPEVNAIGQFATAAPDQKRQASDSISEVEKGLNSIGRKLSDQETKTSTQIREYLKQARTALDSGDVDGAKTLAMKAKVLLGELSP